MLAKFIVIAITVEAILSQNTEKGVIFHSNHQQANTLIHGGSNIYGFENVLNAGKPHIVLYARRLDHLSLCYLRFLGRFLISLLY